MSLGDRNCDLPTFPSPVFLGESRVQGLMVLTFFFLIRLYSFLSLYKHSKPLRSLCFCFAHIEVNSRTEK